MLVISRRNDENVKSYNSVEDFRSETHKVAPPVSHDIFFGSKRKDFHPHCSRFERKRKWAACPIHKDAILLFILPFVHTLEHTFGNNIVRRKYIIVNTYFVSFSREKREKKRKRGQKVRLKFSSVHFGTFPLVFPVSLLISSLFSIFSCF